MSAQQTIADLVLLQGDISVRNILYQDKKSSYAIVKAVAPAGKNPTLLVTYKGNFDNLTIGACYHVEGTMEKETKAGYEKNWYFKVKTSTPSEGATSTEGLQRYLVQEGPQIGDVRAKELVDAFGMEVIRVLAQKPHEILQKIHDMPQARLETLHQWAKDELVLSQVKKKLYEWKLTPGLISKIITTYGRNTADILKKDPYRITDIKGIGFKTASVVGNALGCPKDDPRRLQAGILYVLELELQDGNVCLPYDILLYKAEQLLGVPREPIIAAIKLLTAASKLATQHTAPGPLARNQELFFPVETF